MDQEELSDAKKAKVQNEGKREFGCPCGKTYLSYPALFTHVKQKHNGKAPGKLIKPKTQKARGRPKIHIEVPDEDASQEHFIFQDEIQQALEGITIDYDEPFIRSEGERSCQDMASIFYEKLSHLNQESQKVLNCFLNELKHAVKNKFGESHWTEEKPNEIIDIANDICHDHEKNKKMFPIERKTLISLMLTLFRWMYKNKWTDHKLLKKNS